MLRRGVLNLGRRQIGSGPSATVTAASNHLLRQRTPATVFRAWFSSYPDHELVGLPALSPVRN